MAEQVGDPKLTTTDVKPLDPSAAREIGTFEDQATDTAGLEVCPGLWKVGNDWKLTTAVSNNRTPRRFRS